MRLKDMFVKQIDRDLQGVIKVGQDDQQNIKQELEEYVVTDELQKHFRSFFSAYNKGIIGNTDKMGVWISGFFGSGKSHLLKILSYLLSNQLVDGKTALDYFIEDDKIKDPMVLADMKLACSTSTDSILFNIDSKSDTAGNKDKDAIINVFIKVFNEMQGYSGGYPHLADLERMLDNSGTYELFIQTYEKLENEPWLESRNKFNFKKGKVSKALVEAGIMEESDAKAWIDTTTKPYTISIENFAKMVNEYIKKKGNNHHVAFFVDEVGQYIGSDSQLMLNLQTIVEDLGTFCNGKAWVIVTSQQAIDDITTVKGNDFSKIQGRTDTRISLTSADVSEVIKKRILKKTEVAEETLGVLYETKESIIKNLIIFNDGIEKKNYKNKEDFIESYPFIPYQFDILTKVLTAIREHGSSGKHLSEGERSMLAVFKESAETLKEREEGILISFDKFYNGISRFLDHSHAAVILEALKNNYINPKDEEECFNVDVLKTLFMIKYVKEIKGTIDNITTLMVGDIDEDRLLLREKVIKALDVLISQTLVQQNGDEFIFLTNEEQDVEKMIRKIAISSQEITKKISDAIFGSIYPVNKYQYPAFNNRYSFLFNQEVDGVLRGRVQEDIGLKIITPNSEFNKNVINIKMQSSKENAVYINMPDNDLVIREFVSALKIEKFLSSTDASSMYSFASIKEKKQVDINNHLKRANDALYEGLKNADYYLNGDKLKLETKEIRSSITEAMGKLVNQVYSKLHYINEPMDIADINNILKKETHKTMIMDGSEAQNELALRELMAFIRLKTKGRNKISIKEIKDYFKKAPYGFIDLDIEWMITRSFKDGKIEFTMNGNPVSLFNGSPDKILDYITKKQYADKLLISEKETISENKVKVMKNLAKAMFRKDLNADNTDSMVVEFNYACKDLKENLKDIMFEYRYGNYPGKHVIEDGSKLLNNLLELKAPKEVFDYVFENQGELENLIEDYKPIEVFFEGAQKDIWNKAKTIISIYDDSKNYLLNDNIESIVKKMIAIINMEIPYDHIKDLPQLRDEFNRYYNEELDVKLEPVFNEIIEIENFVVNLLEIKELEEKFKVRINNSFNEIKDKAKSCGNLKDLNSFTMESEVLREKFINAILDYSRTIKPSKSDGDDFSDTTKKQKKKQKINLYKYGLPKKFEIESEEQLEEYLNTIRKILITQMKEDVILEIE